MTPPPFPAAAIAAARDSAREHLRTVGTADDAAIAAQAETALALCEAFTGLSLIAREWSARVPADGLWHRLEMGPVMMVTTELDAAVDIDAAGDGWVRRSGGGVVGVTYAAGLVETWGELPAPIRQGVVLLTAHLFNARPDGAAPPTAVAALWRPYRMVRLSRAERAA